MGRLVVELWASLGCGYGLFSERGRKVNDPFPRWRCDTTGWRSVFFQSLSRSYRSIDHGKGWFFCFNPLEISTLRLLPKKKKHTRHFGAILGIYSLNFRGFFQPWMDTSDRLVDSPPPGWCITTGLQLCALEWNFGWFFSNEFWVERCLKTWSCTVLQVKTLDFSGVFLCAGLYIYCSLQKKLCKF